MTPRNRRHRCPPKKRGASAPWWLAAAACERSARLRAFWGERHCGRRPANPRSQRGICALAEP